MGVAVQITAHFLGKKSLVFLVYGKLRLGEDISLRLAPIMVRQRSV